MRFLVISNFDCGHRDSEGTPVVYFKGEEISLKLAEAQELLRLNLIEEIPKRETAKEEIEKELI